VAAAQVEPPASALGEWRRVPADAGPADTLARTRVALASDLARNAG